MLGRHHAGTALAVLALLGCNAGPNNGPAATAGGGGGGTGTAPPSGTQGPIAPPLVTTPGTGAGTGSGVPSSAAWMTEDEEVAWMNSLGFRTTTADLRASYKKFVPKTINARTNVLWDTESDDLRNYYRLYKRTNDPGFLKQAEAWHAFQVDVYSRWQSGGNNVVEPEHVYLMGLVDWWLDHKDQPTLDAIDRIIDFVKTVKGDPFYETRVSARCLLCLCYYVEKIGIRTAEITPKIQEFVRGVRGAKVDSGFTVFKFVVGTNFSIDNKPASIDLQQRFPKDAAARIVTAPDKYDLKGFEGAGTYQDCILMHALHVAGRALKDSTLDAIADRIAAAWAPHVAAPFWDTTGQYALTVPYYLLTSAPERDLFHFPGRNTPLYVTQYAAFCPDAGKKKLLSQQALLRAYGELDAVKGAELGGKPRYWLWETWEQGYFLTQK